MSNAADRLVRSVNPERTRGRLEGVADTRNPVDRQLDQAPETTPTAPTPIVSTPQPAPATAPAGAQLSLTADRSVWKLTVPITHDGENIRRELKKLCLDRGVTVEQFARDALNAHLTALGITGITIR